MNLNKEELEVLVTMCDIDLEGTEHAYEETIRDRSVESAEDLVTATAGLHVRADIVKRLRDRFEKELSWWP